MASADSHNRGCVQVASPVSADALAVLLEPVRAALVNIDTVLRELRALSRRYNVVCGDGDAVDIYLNTKIGLAILQIPFDALRAFPNGGGAAASIKLLHGNLNAADALQAAVASQRVGVVGGLTQLCARVAAELARLQ